MALPLRKCLEAVLASTGCGRWAPKAMLARAVLFARIQYRERAPRTGVQGQPVAVGGL